MLKTFRRERNVLWAEYDCAESNNHVVVGKEYYFLSGDGYLMPTQGPTAAGPAVFQDSEVGGEVRASLLRRLLAIEFKEADAEALPFADGAFDTVLSTFGVMFAPNQEKAAAELVRVCKSNGQIGLANWTPEGFIGQCSRRSENTWRLLPARNLPALGDTRTARRNVRPSRDLHQG